MTSQTVPNGSAATSATVALDKLVRLARVKGYSYTRAGHTVHVRPFVRKDRPHRPKLYSPTPRRALGARVGEPSRQSSTGPDPYAPNAFLGEPTSIPSASVGNATGDKPKRSATKPDRPPKVVKQFRVLGTTTDVTECEQCGRTDLKSTIVLMPLDADGNGLGDPVYFGSECGSKATGWTQRETKARAKAADVANRKRQSMARNAKDNAEREAKEAWVQRTYGMSWRDLTDLLFSPSRVAELPPSIAPGTRPIQISRLFEDSPDYRAIQDRPASDWLPSEEALKQAMEAGYTMTTPTAQTSPQTVPNGSATSTVGVGLAVDKLVALTMVRGYTYTKAGHTIHVGSYSRTDKPGFRIVDMSGASKHRPDYHKTAKTVRVAGGAGEAKALATQYYKQAGWVAPVIVHSHNRADAREQANLVHQGKMTERQAMVEVPKPDTHTSAAPNRPASSAGVEGGGRAARAATAGVNPELARLEGELTKLKAEFRTKPLGRQVPAGWQQADRSALQAGQRVKAFRSVDDPLAEGQLVSVGDGKARVRFADGKARTVKLDYIHLVESKPAAPNASAKTSTGRPKTEADYEALGRQGYAQGLSSSPLQHPQVMAELGDLAPGEGTRYMRAYSRGWTQANITAPVEGMPTLTPERLAQAEQANKADRAAARAASRPRAPRAPRVSSGALPGQPRPSDAPSVAGERPAPTKGKPKPGDPRYDAYLKREQARRTAHARDVTERAQTKAYAAERAAQRRRQGEQAAPQYEYGGMVGGRYVWKRKPGT